MLNEKLKMGKFIKHKDCRFCGSEDLVKILDFNNVPLAGGFLKEAQFRNEEYFPLDLNFCNRCSLVQVSNEISPEVLFKNYFYFSSSIQTLVTHLNEFAEEINEKFLKSRNNPSVFEIGCNDGVLLKPFADRGVKAVGMDPATNVVDSIDSNDITVINDFFGEKTAGEVHGKYGCFDAICSSYSFAHIPDMIDVMKGVKLLLKDDGVFVFEVYYLGTLIDEMQYDMIYHEHLSYYSLKALTYFFKEFGMEIFDTKFTPGVRSGAVRFYARNVGGRSEEVSENVIKMRDYENKKGFDKAETFLGYAEKVNHTKKQLLKVLDELKADGKTIIGYGASGRGTTIMNYCGINRNYLDYVVDDAPSKHGFFTPGTHVPIHPWEHTKETKLPDYALLFAWSFINEVKAKRAEYLKQGGKFIVPLPEVTIVSA